MEHTVYHATKGLQHSVIQAGNSKVQGYIGGCKKEAQGHSRLYPLCLPHCSPQTPQPIQSALRSAAPSSRDDCRQLKGGCETVVNGSCVCSTATDRSVIMRSPCISQNQRSLHDAVHSSDVVTVWRGGGRYEDIPTTQLVPGDVIGIPPHGCEMHCDAVLMSGTCIVNESMLTGRYRPQAACSCTVTRILAPPSELDLAGSG
jgi:hypothetical protein